MADEAFEIRPGSMVEQCRIVQRLGEGRFGTVYEGRENPSGARVAVYVVHRSMASRPDATERFEKWARSLAALRHPYLAEVRSFGTHDGVPFFVSELPDADTLHVELARAGSFALPLLADLILPVVSVIAASHRYRVRQRVTPYGVFLVTDDDTVTPRVVGTAIAEALVGAGARDATDTPATLFAYLSPEEARHSKNVDLRSDLWSLGALLYTASSGRLPYDEGTREATLAAMITRAPTPLRELRPQLPEAFEALVMKALARDPTERFARAEDVGRALLAFASANERTRWAAEFGAPPTSSNPPRRVTTEPPPRMSTQPPPAMPVSSVPPRASVPPTAEVRRAHIRRVPMFAALTEADVSNLLACVRWRALTPGETLYRQGDSGETMAFVTEGSAGVYVGRVYAEHEVARLGVGSIVGEMAYLDAAPRSATVIALDDVTVGELSRDGLDALTEHAPGLAGAIVGEVVRNVAMKIRGVEERIEAVLAPRRPSSKTPTAVSASDLPAPASSDPPKTRGNSGVWRLVDYLKRIT